MASIKIKINPKKAFAGTTRRGVVLVINHKRERFMYSLNCEPVEPEHLIMYDNGSAEISPKAKYYDNRHWTNNFILSEKKRIEEYLLSLKETGKLDMLSITDLSNAIKNQNNKNGLCFFSYANLIIEERKKTGKFNTARGMNSAMGSIKLFKNTLTFDEINYNFLIQFENYFMAKGRTFNGLACILKYVRTIYNRAMNEGIIDEKNYPFKRYKIKTTKTKKRAISTLDIQKIINYVPSCNSEAFAKDIFMFSFYNAGINIKDIAFLTKANIVNNRLIYSRGKTSDNFNFSLNKESLAIIEKYKDNEKYLFPVILQHKLKGSELLYHLNNRNKRINLYLKQIGTKLKFPEPLTTYVARHSFATIAKKKNIPITIISELLGHEDIKTTQIYLDSLENETLDKYKDEIVSLV